MQRAAGTDMAADRFGQRREQEHRRPDPICQGGAIVARETARSMNSLTEVCEIPTIFLGSINSGRSCVPTCPHDAGGRAAGHGWPKATTTRRRGASLSGGPANGIIRQSRADTNVTNVMIATQQ